VTHLEYTRKKDAIAVSEASYEVKEAAMQKLEAQYSYNSVEKARKQFLESSPDISDIGDGQ
jgi:hypothetical protein